MSRALITKTQKKKLQKNLQKKSKNRYVNQSDLNKRDIEELREKFKTRGFTAGEIIGLIFAVILGVPAGVVVLIIIGASLFLMFKRDNVFGKQNIKKNKFFKKINTQIKKDYLKKLTRRKKLNFNKSDKQKIKEIQKTLARKGYTKVEIVGIMLSTVFKVPVKVGIQYTSNLVKKIISLS